MAHLKERIVLGMVMIFGLFPVAHADTTRSQIGPIEPIMSQHLMMAIIYANPALSKQLHRSVWDSPERNWRRFDNANMKLQAIPPVAKVCKESLAHLRKLHAEDLANESHRYLPVADIYYLDSGELVTHLENIEDPAFDRAAYDAMGKTYEELFGQRISHIMDRNVCWDLMSRPFDDGKNTPLVQQGCSAFDELRQCIEEMRHIDALSLVRRQLVRDGYYEGKIPERVNPWRKN